MKQLAVAWLAALVLAPLASSNSLLLSRETRRPWEAGELVRLPTKQRVVALTLDGGGNNVGAARMLATLKREQVPATFFLTGRFVRLYPALARRIGESYLVGNHTYDHATLPGLPSSAVRSEIVRAAGVIRKGTGRDPRPLFRFPYGARDSRTLAIANSLGYTSVRWTADTLGWMGAAQRGRAVPHILANLEPGAILLVHVGAARDGSTVDADVLPTLIRAIRARGYRFVTLSDVPAPKRSSSKLLQG
jgi:peptidoglycan/xylan/chitin deacetylase (PgdA/CDA1 family)